MNFQSTQLGEKYISDHNNPITKKVELFGSKLFLSRFTPEQEQRKERFLEDIECCLKHDRVDRRAARSVAEWLPEQNMAKVVKVTGLLHNFGIQNKSGKFLSAEEALFLLEINKLELMYNKVSMSIEEAYKNVRCLKKYLAYKQLASYGCKLKKPCEMYERQKEREEDDCYEPPAKLAKVIDNVTEVLEKLKQNAPKNFTPKSDFKQVMDYCVNMPKGSEKMESFNLIVDTNEEYMNNADGNNNKVFALTSDNDLSFYKFYNTNIPIL